MKYRNCFDVLCKAVLGAMFLSVTGAGVSCVHGGKDDALYAACCATMKELSAAEARTRGRIAGLIEGKRNELERLLEEKQALTLEIEQWEAGRKKRESQLSSDLDIAELKHLIQQWKAVTMQKRMDELTQRIRREKEELVALQAMNNESVVKSAEFERLQFKLEGLKLETERLQAELNVLTQEKTREEAELNAQLTQSQKVGKELDEWKVKCQSQQAQDAERQKRIVELEQQIAGKNSEASALRERVEALQKQVEAKVQEIEVIRTKVMEKSDILDRINRSNAQQAMKAKIREILGL